MFCAAALAPFLAGCSSTHKVAGDPLFGEFGPKGTGPEYSAPATPTKTKAEISTTPTSGLTPSLSALAALPDSSRPLYISQPKTAVDPAPVSSTLTSTASADAGATLGVPQPIVQAVPRAQTDPVVPASSWGQAPAIAAGSAAQTPLAPVSVSVPPPASWVNPARAAATDPGAAATATADDPLLAQLRARGITWQNAKTDPGGVRFSCIVPNAQNPNVTRMYEAIGPDYPAAVRAVLWKIDQDRK